MFSRPKHLAFAPLYLKQAHRIRRDTPSLPEPSGSREGILNLSNNRDASITSSVASVSEIDKKASLFRLMIVGDSSAAGVGVDSQDNALMGRLLLALSEHDDFINKYSSVDWMLHATTGHTSFDVLRRLYVLPEPRNPLDVMVITVGVNDVTQMQTDQRRLKNWLHNLNEIMIIVKQKFRPKNVVFTALPPVNQFPTLPYPLNEFIGEKALQIDNALAEFCQKREDENIYYAKVLSPFEETDYAVNFFRDEREKLTEYFASDGFHPGALAYQIWGNELAELIAELG